MLQDFKSHIETNFSFLEGKQVLIAISGGVDSVVLTHLMCELKMNVSLAHCNFQLRGKESDLDEDSINELAKQLAIKVFTVRFDTKEYSQKNKLSTQVAARELRYDFFEELIKKYHFDYVLTAHHADDNLETILINLTRGTGLEGLTGIPEQNKKIIRPLLPFSRLSILDYAKKNTIYWREDKSNSEKKYIRNKIRHQIVPVLKEINPNLLNSFNKTTGYLQESLTIVNDSVKEVSKDIIEEEKELVKINIEKVLKLSNPKAYLYQFLKTYEFKEWDKVYDLLSAQSGKVLRTNSHVLLKNREFLVLSLLQNRKQKEDKEYYIYQDSSSLTSLPMEINIENSENVKVDEKKSILVDKNLVIYPLVLRKRKEGDVFYPKGMFGKKKISKYFKDEKLSLFEKQSTWLLCTEDDKIIWVVGLRQDRRFQINNKTKNILKISI